MFIVIHNINPMKVGFDFDHVLFKTGRLKQHLIDCFDSFLETYDDAKDKDGNYRPGHHATMMGIKRKAFDRAVDQVAEKCLYDDYKALRALNDHECLVVTRGDPDFQKLKVRSCGVEAIVDGVIVVEKRPKDATGIDFLVDDSPEEHERSNVPGLLFERPDHTVDFAAEAIRAFRP